MARFIDARVEDDGLVSGKNGGGAGPASMAVKGIGRPESDVEGSPVDEVTGDGVTPSDIAPLSRVWVVLVEEVIDAIV